MNFYQNFSKFWFFVNSSSEYKIFAGLYIPNYSSEESKIFQKFLSVVYNIYVIKKELWDFQFFLKINKILEFYMTRI